MYQVRQIYKTGVLVEDHAPEIKKMIEGAGVPLPRVEAWVCDHDAEDRATLEKHLNIKTRAAYKGVSSGIEAVNGRFKRNKLFLNTRALVEADSSLEKVYKPLCTSEEITGYSWALKKQDTPVKENDHGCDEMRYAVAYIDKVGSSSQGVSASANIQNYIQGKRRDNGPH